MPGEVVAAAVQCRVCALRLLLEQRDVATTRRSLQRDHSGASLFAPHPYPDTVAVGAGCVVTASGQFAYRLAAIPQFLEVASRDGRWPRCHLVPVGATLFVPTPKRRRSG